ncbi:MAG: hypothetical protein QM778_25895 [Myxococcales bacterium]
MTAKAFAELEGLPRAGALSWWRHQLAARDKKSLPVVDGPVRLVRLEAVPTTPSGKRRGREEAVVAPIEIACGAYRVVVRAGFDPMMLEGVLRALERAR